jgi:hypothetical protein
VLLTRPARRLPAALPACLQYVVGMVGNYAEQLQAAKFCLAPYGALGSNSPSRHGSVGYWCLLLFGLWLAACVLGPRPCI